MNVHKKYNVRNIKIISHINKNNKHNLRDRRWQVQAPVCVFINKPNKQTNNLNKTTLTLTKKT